MKKIILCADDYGQNEAISQAIITLIEKNHLSATSCMTTSPNWPTHAEWLKPHKNKIDIGLHFNLTEGQPLSAALTNSHGFLPLPRLIICAYTQRLNLAAIEAELHAQLDRFYQVMGQLPDFIDGHQHIHQFPLVRKVLLHVYEQRLRNQRCYLRCTHDPRLMPNQNYAKRLILQVLGASAMKRELLKNKIPHNASFAGVYSFTKAALYSTLFPQFLAEIKPSGLIMCHPGASALDETDVIAEARYHEFQYLNSDSFVQDCFAHGVVIGRYKSFNL